MIATLGNRLSREYNNNDLFLLDMYSKACIYSNSCLFLMLFSKVKRHIPGIQTKYYLAYKLALVESNKMNAIN